MVADHGFMTVYYKLDPQMRLPMVPIVMNCTQPPLMTLRHAYDFGAAVGDAIRSYPAWSGSPCARREAFPISSASHGG
jgi:Catalytic LigB subunit of aromatic ring-opening dioxygenase.